MTVAPSDAESKGYITELHRFNTRPVVTYANEKVELKNTHLDVRSFKPPIEASTNRTSDYYTYISDKWTKENEITCVDYDDTLSDNGSLVLFIGTKFGLVLFDTYIDPVDPSAVQCKPRLYTMSMREYNQRYPYTHTNFEDHECQYLEVDRINKILFYLVKDELCAARYTWVSKQVQNQKISEVELLDLAKVNTQGIFGKRKISDFSIQKPDRSNIPVSTKSEATVISLPICVLCQDTLYFLRVNINKNTGTPAHQITSITSLNVPNIRTMIYAQNHLAVLSNSNKYSVAMFDNKTNRWKFVYFSDQQKALPWWREQVLSVNPDLYGDFAPIIAGDSNLVPVNWGKKREEILGRQKDYSPKLIFYSDPFLIGKSSRQLKLIPRKIPALVAESRKFESIADCRTGVPIPGKGFLILGTTKIRYYKYKDRSTMIKNIVMQCCFSTLSVPTDAHIKWKSVIPLFEYFFVTQSERAEKLKNLQRKVGKTIIRHGITKDLLPKSKKPEAILKHYQNGFEILKETDYINMTGYFDETFLEDKKSKKQMSQLNQKRVSTLLPYFLDDRLERNKLVTPELKMNIVQEFFAYLSFQKAAYTVKDRSQLEHIDKILLEYIIFLVKELENLPKDIQKARVSYVKDRFNDLIVSSTLSQSNAYFLQSKLEETRQKKPSAVVDTFLELLHYRYRDYLKADDDSGLASFNMFSNVELQDQINNFSKRPIEIDTKTNPLLVRQLRDVVKRMKFRGDSDEKIATTLLTSSVFEGEEFIHIFEAESKPKHKLLYRRLQLIHLKSLLERNNLQSDPGLLKKRILNVINCYFKYTQSSLPSEEKRRFIDLKFKGFLLPKELRLPGGEEPFDNQLGVVKRDFRKFISSPVFQLLPQEEITNFLMLKPNNVFEYPYVLDERIWLFQKLGLHSDALYIIIFVLEDMEFADRYCKEVYSVESKSPFFNQKKNVYNILADLCYKGVPDPSLSNMLPASISHESSCPKFWKSAEQLLKQVRLKFWSNIYDSCQNHLKLLRQSVILFALSLGISLYGESRPEEEVPLFKTILLQYDANCSSTDYEMTLFKFMELQDDVIFHARSVVNKFKDLEKFAPKKVPKSDNPKEPPSTELLEIDFHNLVYKYSSPLLPDNLKEDLEHATLQKWDKTDKEFLSATYVLPQLMDSSLDNYPDLKMNFWNRVQSRRERTDQLTDSFVLTKLQRWLTFFEVALFAISRIKHGQYEEETQDGAITVSFRESINQIQNYALKILELNASKIKLYEGLPFEEHKDSFLDALNPSQLIYYDSFIEKAVHSQQNQKRLNQIRIKNLEALRKQKLYEKQCLSNKIARIDAKTHCPKCNIHLKPNTPLILYPDMTIVHAQCARNDNNEPLPLHIHPFTGTNFYLERPPLTQTKDRRKIS